MVRILKFLYSYDAMGHHNYKIIPFMGKMPKVEGVGCSDSFPA